MSTLAMRRPGRAFTLIEMVVLVCILGVLAGVAIPVYIDYTTNAKAAAAKGTLGAVRSAISTFYLNSAMNGTAAYPTLVQLQTLDTVLHEALPVNPYNNSKVIAAATWAATPPTSGNNGWNYDAASGRIWLNSNTGGLGENFW